MSFSLSANGSVTSITNTFQSVSPSSIKAIVPYLLINYNNNAKDTQNLDLFNLTSKGNSFTDFTYIQWVVITWDDRCHLESPYQINSWIFKLWKVEYMYMITNTVCIRMNMLYTSQRIVSWFLPLDLPKSEGKLHSSKYNHDEENSYEQILCFPF